MAKHLAPVEQPTQLSSGHFAKTDSVVQDRHANSNSSDEFDSKQKYVTIPHLPIYFH